MRALRPTLGTGPQAPRPLAINNPHSFQCCGVLKKPHVIGRAVQTAAGPGQDYDTEERVLRPRGPGPSRSRDDEDGERTQQRRPLFRRDGESSSSTGGEGAGYGGGRFRSDREGGDDESDGAGPRRSYRDEERDPDRQRGEGGFRPRGRDGGWGRDGGRGRGGGRYGDSGRDRDGGRGRGEGGRGRGEGGERYERGVERSRGGGERFGGGGERYGGGGERYGGGGERYGGGGDRWERREGGRREEGGYNRSERRDGGRQRNVDDGGEDSGRGGGRAAYGGGRDRDWDERRSRDGGREGRGGGGERYREDRDGRGERRPYGRGRDEEEQRGGRSWRDERDSPSMDAGADPDADEAPPPPPAPRPPGSSTGNRPLPYDLPIVRPHDGDKGTFFAGSSWRQAGASEEVVAALKALGMGRPSHIQAQAFAAFFGKGAGGGAGGEDGDAALVLADQAGSGKTLAYLLPLLQTLREEEKAAGGRVTKPNCPRAIVVAPTVELVQQVLRVARAVSGAGLKFRSAAFTGGQADERARATSMRTQKALLSEGVDLVVATPGRLSALLESGALRLNACRGLVLDEVDVLLGDTADFASQVSPLRAAAPASLRWVLVSATLPGHAMAQLREQWPALQPVFGPGLHRTASGLVEELVDCSGGEDISEESGRKRKLEALQSLLQRHRAARTLVFCNKIEACRDVENFLKRTDPSGRQLRVLPYHEAIRDEFRAEAMRAFLQPVEAQAGQRAAPRQERQEGGQGEGGEAGAEGGEGGAEQLVLVATDRTSRGIDALYCEHVVLFDFPRDPSEYVRRVGRTARGAGGRGVVSSLVLGRQVPLAREIIERNQKGMPVHSVPE